LEYKANCPPPPPPIPFPLFLLVHPKFIAQSSATWLCRACCIYHSDSGKIIQPPSSPGGQLDLSPFKQSKEILRKEKLTHNIEVWSPTAIRGKKI